MAVKINIFSGIRPRFPESLLPVNCATIAQNCDLAYGELRNTRDGFPIGFMTNRPKSIYTDDGLTFYTWESDVNAVRSPMVKDPHNLMYYTDGAGVKVALRTGTRTNGGPPSASYKAGVPRPTVAPVLSVPAVASIDGATITAKFHYESGGVKYQEGAITLTQVTANKTWTFTPPAMNTSGTTGGTGNFAATGFMQWVDDYNGGHESWTNFSVTNIDVISFNQVRYNGAVYTATQVKDGNGQIHNTESLFTLKTYGSVVAPGSTSTAATPSAAVPVVRMLATKGADNTGVFDIYSDNSTLNTGTGVWKLSITKDQNATTYTLNLVSDIAEADKETRAYQYVYVNIYGQMGPPSPPGTITTTPVMDVNAVVTVDANTAGYAPISEVWIYRTPSGSTIADYFYAGKVPVLMGGPTFTFLDNVKGAELNDDLISDGYYPPPDDLTGLMTLSNGILCGWRANEVWFSEAYKGWAWNPANVRPLAHNVVGGIPHGSGAIVTTTAKPVLVSGVSPDAMTDSALNIPQAGVSKWSVASANGVVIYASNDGLVVLNGGTGSLAQSEQFFTRDIWRQRYGQYLSSMCFSVWDGRLVVFSNTGSFVPFMIRFDEADGTMTDLPSLAASCAFVSLVSDQFYYANGTSIYQFNGGSDLAATWQSREEWTATPENYGFAQAVVKAGSWQIQFFADGVLKRTKTVGTGITDFRLPSGFKAYTWQVKITGTGRFSALRYARTAVELAKV